MTRRGRAIGDEFAESERQTQAMNESFERDRARRRIAVQRARAMYETDDIEIDPPDEFTGSIADPGDQVESVDGGYWVLARVWVPFEDVEDA